MVVRAVRRIGRAQLLGWMVAVATGASAGRAGAQSLSLGLNAPGDAALVVPSSEVLGDGTLRSALTLVTSSEPLSLVLPSLDRDSVVEQRTELALGASYTSWHRLLVAVTLPVVLAQSGEVSAADSTAPRVASGRAFGDANLTLRTFLIGAAERRLGLSVQGDLWLPTGSKQAYATDDLVRAGLVAILGGRSARHGWSFEIGAQSRREQSFEGVVPYRMGHELVTGLAAEFPLDHAARLWVGSEIEAQSAFTNGAQLFDPRSSRGVWLASLSWRVRGSPLRLTLALGPGFGEGAGAGAWHALARAAWAPVVAPPAPDADDDGVADAEDACRELAGAPSADPVMHGCPDLPKDEDGDGIPSELDACPRAAGLPSAVPNRHGCPVVSAPEATSPLVPTPAAKPLAEVDAERIVIHQQVQFETGTSALRPESAEVLGQVAEILRVHPEITRVEVQGHTDEVGTRDFNQRLSAGRALAVVHWLVQQGVAAERLVARGYGSDVPLATNATEQGRRTNRRVEFRILERADPTRAEPGTPESEASP